MSDLSKRIDALGAKSAQARVGIEGNQEANAVLDRLDARLLSLTHKSSIPLSIEGTARAAAEISALELELDRLKEKAGSKSSGAAGALSAVAGTGGIPGGGMGALIAAGVVLSPVIATLGVGLGGLAAAAYGTVKPIEAAAQKTGGLSANMKLLDPEQRQLAVSVLGLGKQYDAFQKALQPEVLGVFNQGLKLAGGLMKDVQPVAAATGTALQGLLAGVDKEFRSGMWQQFFGWMAAQAGPDVKLVGDNLTGLLNLLPPLLEQLQPLARSFLILTTDVISAGDALVAAANKGEHFITWARNAANTGAQNNSVWHGVWTVIRGITDYLPTGQSSFLRFAGGINAASLAQQSVTTAAQAWLALPFVRQLGLDTTAVQALTTAQNTALSTQLAYGNAMLASANDAAALQAKLKLSSGMIGTQTQTQRDSFGAAQTYIKDLGDQATQAIASGHGTDAAIAAIRNGLPILDSAKSKNRQYWLEVQTLVGWLDKLRAEKAISEAIHVSGTGVWTVTPGKIGLPGGTAGGPFAAGGRIPGYGGGDRYPVLVEGGETILPKHLTPLVASFARAHGVPGFAAGGVTGSYGGNVAGLGPWAGGELNATVHGVAMSVAQALVSGIKAGMSPGPASGGTARWAPAAAQALGMAGLGPSYVHQVLYQMGTESGGNPYAVNRSDINWQLGHPSVGLMQVIQGTFDMFAGSLRGLGPYEYGVSINPLANIYSAIKYAQAVYGPTMMSGGNGLGSGHGYDQGGWLPAGASIAVNNTGAAEAVVPGAKLDTMIGLLDEIAGRLAELTGVTASSATRTGAALGAALGQASRSAVYSSLYP